MPVRLRLVLASALMLFTELHAHPLAGRQPAAPVLLLQHRAARVVPRHRPRLPRGQAGPRAAAAGSPRRSPCSSSPCSFIPGGVDRTGSDLIYFTAVSTATVAGRRWSPSRWCSSPSPPCMTGPGRPGGRSASSSCPASTPTASTSSAASPAPCSSRVLSFRRRRPIVWALVHRPLVMLVLVPVPTDRLASRRRGLAVVVARCSSAASCRRATSGRRTTRSRRSTSAAPTTPARQYAAYAVSPTACRTRRSCRLDVRLEQEPFYAQPYERIADGRRRRRARRRRRQRLRRRARAAPRAPRASTRSRSTRASATSASSCTRRSRTTTRASRRTSATAARSCTRPTRSTTS